MYMCFTAIILFNGLIGIFAHVADDDWANLSNVGHLQELKKEPQALSRRSAQHIRAIDSSLREGGDNHEQSESGALVCSAVYILPDCFSCLP